MEKLSSCCGATFIGETDLCSECKEHADVEQDDSLVTGRDSALFIGDCANDRGELDIYTPAVYEMINKQMAQDLIKHLAKVFKIDGVLEAVELYQENNRGEK